MARKRRVSKDCEAEKAAAELARKEHAALVRESVNTLEFLIKERKRAGGEVSRKLLTDFVQSARQGKRRRAMQAAANRLIKKGAICS